MSFCAVPGRSSLTKLLKAIGWLNDQKPALTDPSGLLAKRTKRAIQAGNQGPIQKGPRGGLYRINANGQKVYLKQEATGRPRRARRRRHKHDDLAA